jgi:hypothetical protein
MPDSVLKQITRLLERAHEQHAEYEASALNGQYDEQWPDWYAAWLIGQGINDFLNIDLQTPELTTLLIDITEQHKQSGDESSWYAYTAAQLIETAS